LNLAGQNNDILFKDSVYCALGLAAPILEKNLDIDQLVRYILVKEVGTRENGYNIIRRRAAILLGSWAPMGYPNRTQNVVNKVFKCLLDKGDKLNDIVVRVTAGRQLKNVADAFEFNNVEFQDEAHGILYALMGLITEVDLTETKLALLNTLSVIIERMSELVSISTCQLKISSLIKHRCPRLRNRFSTSSHLAGSRIHKIGC